MIPGIWYVIEENVILEYDESKNEDLLKYTHISDSKIKDNVFGFLDEEIFIPNNKNEKKLNKKLWEYIKTHKDKIEIKNDYVVYLYDQDSNSDKNKRSKIGELQSIKNSLKSKSSKSSKNKNENEDDVIESNKIELQKMINFDEGCVVFVQCDGINLYIKWKHDNSNNRELISCHSPTSNEKRPNEKPFCIDYLEKEYT